MLCLDNTPPAAASRVTHMRSDARGIFVDWKKTPDFTFLCTFPCHSCQILWPPSCSLEGIVWVVDSQEGSLSSLCRDRCVEHGLIKCSGLGQTSRHIRTMCAYPLTAASTVSTAGCLLHNTCKDEETALSISRHQNHRRYCLSFHCVCWPPRTLKIID